MRKNPKIKLSVVFDIVTCGDVYRPTLDDTLKAIIMRTIAVHGKGPYRYLFHGGGKDAYLALGAATLVMSHAVLQEVRYEEDFGCQENLQLHPLQRTRRVFQKLNGATEGMIGWDLWQELWPPAEEVRRRFNAALVRHAKEIAEAHGMPNGCLTIFTTGRLFTYFRSNMVRALVVTHSPAVELSVADPMAIPILNPGDIIRTTVEVADDGIVDITASHVLRAVPP